MISNRYLHNLLLILLTGMMLLFSSATTAQSTVVYGVFFYSPTCPHCHEVINNHWPSIQNEFGDQLRVLFIDASTPEGGRIMQDAGAALGFQANGVPLLIIGSVVLVGSVDIPERTPLIVRAGLDAGGIGLPAIPGIQARYDLAFEQSSHVETYTERNLGLQAEQATTILQRLTADPVANGLAIFILILLVLSLVTRIGLIVSKPSKTIALLARRDQRAILLLTALIGLGMTLSLLAGWAENLFVLLLAAGLGVIFLVIAATSVRVPLNQTLPRWLVPFVTVGGFAVAAYLTIVELTLSEAVCGVVGNCNTVQQSSYARIMNIPVGLFGMGAYLSIIVLWVLSKQPRYQAGANWLVRNIVLLGVGFSIYLTFLEPFVIGATCLWCLTSAVLMMVLLWLLIPSVFEQKRYRSAYSSK